jgi:hypothetical protein
MKNTLPLKEVSILEIYNGEKATYEVPIYQRNYAWGQDEISTLIQDVYDAYSKNTKTIYFIGTLVSFHKGESIFEVIDGQQRLTTINLVLNALEIPIKNKLTYRARQKSNNSIQSIPDFHIEEKDEGIVNGFKYAQSAIKEIIPKECKDKFKDYFQNSVHLIHYQVPKDIDLNHYFEIMNSRGEQLEKHEIVKARLIEKLSVEERATFNLLWENCSEMGVYIQQKYREKDIFGEEHCEFKISSFDSLPRVDNKLGMKKISDILEQESPIESQNSVSKKENKIDTFQPIIDFPNFLLIVLKITRMKDPTFDPKSFNLDDKELVNEFEKITIDSEFVKQFSFNLLKAKYLLDNYIVHHSNEEDTLESNPWKLQKWQIDEKKNEFLKNLSHESNNEPSKQLKLVQLLSMFEVSFSPRQRKNYLFYCLLDLFHNKELDLENYYKFVSGLADKFLVDIYLNKDNLSEINTPKPGSFDETVLSKEKRLPDTVRINYNIDFAAIYGDGTSVSKGIPFFVFNYLDYKIWELYCDNLRGEDSTKGDSDRQDFFNKLGCKEFKLEVFKQFYFSSTRRSLEHFFPQANVSPDTNTPSQEQINCFGNYAMIGGEANSSGSNWTPKSKLNHYLDASRKIKLVSVASLKFMIMMQICIDNETKDAGLARDEGLEWNFEDIEKHQEKMLGIFKVV